MQNEVCNNVRNVYITGVFKSCDVILQVHVTVQADFSWVQPRSAQGRSVKQEPVCADFSSHGLLCYYFDDDRCDSEDPQSLETVNVCSRCCVNTCSWYWDISQDKRNLWPAVDTRGKVRGSTRSGGFTLRAPWMNVANFKTIHLIFVEIFQSGSKLCMFINWQASTQFDELSEWSVDELTWPETDKLILAHWLTLNIKRRVDRM